MTGEGGISVSLSLDAASVQSGNGARDRHLRSDDFFAADRHPNVTFIAGGVDVIDHERAHVEGVLTAAGRPHPIALDVDLRASASTVVVDGEVTVDRATFGMTWSPLGMAASAAVLTVHLVFTSPG